MASEKTIKLDDNLVNAPLPEMPLLPITSPATVRACRAMAVSSNDVFVCSFPKSGTTWNQNIVVRLLWEIAATAGGAENGNACRPLPEDWHLSETAPFYEVDRYWQARKDGDNNQEEPLERIPAQTPIRGGGDNDSNEYRVFNTHLLPHQLPPNARCIYVLRDPFDVMVSFYHHLSSQSEEDGGYTGSFDDFFEGFLNGTIVYGKWQDHIEAWLGGRRSSTDASSSFLLLHYEDMKEDLARETRRLARFLLGGESESGELVNDDCVETIVSKVVPSCTFEAMKQEREKYTPRTVTWKIDPETGKPFSFVRKGVVGDGRRLVGETPSSSFLRDRWIHRDAPLARARWKKAGVDQAIIDRYL